MRKVIALLMLCVSMIFLGACTAKSSTSVLDETEVAVSQATPTVIVPVSLEPAVDNCVVCHTDQQMLTDTSSEEEEDLHGSESEGVG